MKDIGDRMKEYESIPRAFMTRRMPYIIRIDGKAFHTFTKNLDKPWDEGFKTAMLDTAQKLCQEIQGVKLAYWQSDEISLLLTDYDTLATQAWFDKNIQKITSISASIATYYFSYYMGMQDTKNVIRGRALFDSRTFVLPKEDTCNYFIWRQQDAVRNSIQGLAQSKFSHKQLHKHSCNQLQEKLFQEKGINWNDIDVWKKRGACVIKDEKGNWIVDVNIPEFTQDRDYIEKRVYIDELEKAKT